MSERMTAVDHKPRAMRAQIAVQPVGVETLVYDEQRHLAFCLNASAGAVWRLADGTRTIAELAEAATAEMGVVMEEEIVRVALDELHAHGLIEAAESGAGVSMSRRTMIARIGIAAMIPVVASIIAPTAAQAYSGCVDCSVAHPLRRSAPPAPGGPNQ